MLDRFERPHDFADAARRQDERVAAGDDDLPNFRMLPDVFEGALEFDRPKHRVRFADHLAAKAEAAIDRA